MILPVTTHFFSSNSLCCIISHSLGIICYVSNLKYLVGVSNKFLASLYSSKSPWLKLTCRIFLLSIITLLLMSSMSSCVNVYFVPTKRVRSLIEVVFLNTIISQTLYSYIVYIYILNGKPSGIRTTHL